MDRRWSCNHKFVTVLLFQYLFNSLHDNKKGDWLKTLTTLSFTMQQMTLFLHQTGVMSARQCPSWHLGFRHLSLKLVSRNKVDSPNWVGYYVTIDPRGTNPLRFWQGLTSFTWCIMCNTKYRWEVFSSTYWLALQKQVQQVSYIFSWETRLSMQEVMASLFQVFKLKTGVQKEIHCFINKRLQEVMACWSYTFLNMKNILLNVDNYVRYPDIFFSSKTA